MGFDAERASKTLLKDTAWLVIPACGVIWAINWGLGALFGG